MPVARRGQHLRPVYIVFTDGEAVLAWSPAAYTIDTHLQRFAELRAFLGLSSDASPP